MGCGGLAGELTLLLTACLLTIALFNDWTGAFFNTPAEKTLKKMSVIPWSRLI
jgi:hypothetical protein